MNIINVPKTTSSIPAGEACAYNDHRCGTSMADPYHQPVDWNTLLAEESNVVVIAAVIKERRSLYL